MPESIVILGHRGGAPGYGENTLAAFEAGLAAGAGVLETDARLTADGSVVLCHDPDTRRIATVDRTIAGSRWRDLQRLPLATEVGEQRLCTLAEALRRLPYAHFNVDLKTKDSALARAVIRTLRAARAIDRVLIASFSVRALARFRRIAPQVRTSAHPLEVLWALAATWLGLPLRIKAVALQVPARMGWLRVVTPRLARYLRRAGIALHVWTINDPVEATALVRLGATGIVTDDVAAMRRALARWAPERDNRASV